MKLKRRALGVAVGALAIGGLGLGAYQLFRFPPDTTPEGAYLRITYALGRGKPLVVFSYLEDAAQHACFTIRDYRKRTLALLERDFPEPERARLVAEYEAQGRAPDGSDVWLLLAEQRGWLGRLRKDLSGVQAVEVIGERATVITAHNTRYAFRKRENGMWGLALFTAELVAEAERAARDFSVVEGSAKDYRGAPQ